MSGDLVARSRAYYGESVRNPVTRDHLGDARQYAERIRPAVHMVSGRISGLRALFGHAVAEAVNHDLEHLAETADECADSFRRGVDDLIADHAQALDRQQLMTSENAIAAARARCILRDALDYEATRRRRDTPEWMTQARELLAEQDAPF